MPRDGNGVFSKPAGTTAVPSTTIESTPYNNTIDDLVADANAARPVAAGGTGATNAASAKVNLQVVTGATGSARAPSGTTAQRDGSPEAGYFRHNSSDGLFEGYGSSWRQFAFTDSPAFSGTPTAPTASSGTDTTQIATTGFVQQELAPSVVPAGLVGWFAANSAPTGWLKANGAAVSRTTYADLFAVIGTTFGAGDGSTTFNLPDLRGEFIRGWDDGRGVDSGRAFGSFQNDEFESHYHNYDSMTSITSSSSTRGILGGTGQGTTSSSNNRSTTEGGSETRPRNRALLACIKF